MEPGEVGGCGLVLAGGDATLLFGAVEGGWLAAVAAVSFAVCLLVGEDWSYCPDSAASQVFDEAQRVAAAVGGQMDLGRATDRPVSGFGRQQRLNPRPLRVCQRHTEPTIR
ncbi:hypothetical protein ACFWAT_14990 [Streptomyces syringium]|uniref:hypothetical protein n=1 Tax=Streptomyces syringium TaxID=76729 RepID=UPI00366A2B82